MKPLCRHGGADQVTSVKKLLIGVSLISVFLLSAAAAQGHGSCRRGCDRALASYYVSSVTTDNLIAATMSVSIPDILRYNPQITNSNFLLTGNRVNVPFSCDCIDGQFLGHVFNFTSSSGDNYTSIVENYFSNLTTVAAMTMYNSNLGFNGTAAGVSLNVVVNCSCGDASVSRRYGLFITYPLRQGETLQSVAVANNLSAELVRNYNPSLNFSAGAGVAFIPGKDEHGNFPTLNSGGLSPGAIAGVSVAVVGGVFSIAGVLFIWMQRKKQAKQLRSHLDEELFLRTIHDTSASRVGKTPGVTHVTLQKSLEFPYEELAFATNNFSLEYKIGEGGFGVVYYAELRGEKAAVKKMGTKASKEFLAELNVLTHVHHQNLVRLIGYCVEGSLFLVYEYVENGNLSQHLRGKEPLSWSTRVQIALDSARGLEYIHEHTVPVYVHRDIKPANILIDKSFRGKVADFGLTKLTEFRSGKLRTGQPAGTFGYMAPEYGHYGDVSAKVDVYAFGVVLYELISAKEAVVKSGSDSKSLVALFEEALDSPDPSAKAKLIDPRLGDDYPLSSVLKMAQLARACTLGNPERRPTMRSIVVSLMSILSSTENLG